MKPLISIDENKLEHVKKSFNDLRDPEDDWQALLKGIINQVMDDYIRLQHPSKRDQVYLKEAFASAISCLWDEDYIIEWPGDNEEETITLSFRELLNHRFGLTELKRDEAHKINMGLIQEECINNAYRYWIDKNLNVIKIPDFLIFEGRAFSIWYTDDESSVDFENMIINLKRLDDPRELSTEFIMLSIKIGCYYKDSTIKEKQVEEIAPIIYELLRMNSCFRV